MKTRQEGGLWLQSAWGRGGDIKAPQWPSWATSAGGVSWEGQNSRWGAPPKPAGQLCRLSLPWRGTEGA